MFFELAQIDASEKGIGPDFEKYLYTFVNCTTAFCCSETLDRLRLKLAAFIIRSFSNH